MQFSDIQLSKRLERAEGSACAQFAAARQTLFPNSGSLWIECAGAYAVFDGIESPVTQSFGLGIIEELNGTSLDTIEEFFITRGAPVLHEISPFAGAAAMQLLCKRNYIPIELSSVLYRAVEKLSSPLPANINVRIIAPDEAELWADVSASGWAHEHPELLDFIRQMGAISVTRKQSVCFLAEVDGQAGAAGVLCLHEGVALLGGASTIPRLRRKGLQSALLQERLRYAFDQGCDTAMMVAEIGSNSQRNAERTGFNIAYTRTKWQLCT